MLCFYVVLTIVHPFDPISGQNEAYFEIFQKFPNQKCWKLLFKPFGWGPRCLDEGNNPKIGQMGLPHRGKP